MRKILLVVLALLLFVTPALADTIDLSGMSYAELKALQARVNNALWNHPNFECVEVPAGLYKIGTDIPSGRWEIHANPNAWLLTVRYGNKLNSTGTSIAYSGSDSKSLTGTDCVFYEEGDASYWTLTLQTGYYIEFEETVIFRKPSAPAFHFN